ncbi:MAG TPA: FAD-dependent oxidoreductase [Acidimicrobiales bacterium]|nr:FAD-dependent oxidoreductase [Acidimicrobiales bacterium]
MERIAIIGSGVSGLVTAHHLHPQGEVVLFEAADRVGGHVNTVEVHEADQTFGIDTGFIVYNERNYPGFSRLLDQLGVATQSSDMSFSVSSSVTGLEYRGTNLNTMLARRGNALRPSFVRMVADVPRFNRLARSLLDHDDVTLSLEDFLRRERFSPPFIDDYLIPLGAAIWSANPQEFSAFPVTSLARFLDQHGLLSLGNRPPWRTVAGGARNYVEALIAPLRNQVRTRCAVRQVERDEVGVLVRSDARPEGERFDRVVFATHADTTLALLAVPTVHEAAILGSFRFQCNRATLHTDARLLPRRRRAWASWNYRRTGDDQRVPMLTYYANRLQDLASETNYCITLNADDVIDPSSVITSFDYSHPTFDEAAVRAQRRHDEIDGRLRTHYVGAYWGYGFHEDGVQSALRVVERMRDADEVVMAR